MTAGKFFFEKKFIFAFAVYFIVTFILLFQYGVQTGGEAEKYLDNANRILRGDELRNGFFGIFYIAYSLIITFFVKFSIPLVFVAILQLVVSFIAALAFYKLLLNAFQKEFVAFLFFIAYLCCYPIQKWSYFLYSEGLHTSFVVIGIYFFDILLAERRKLLWSFIPALLLISFSRPTGLIFLTTAALVSLMWLYRSNRKILFYLFSFLFLIGVVGIANSPLTAFVNPDSLRRMEVICQVPASNTDTAYQEFNRAGLMKAYTTIRDDIGFGNFFRLGMEKLGRFFGMYRPYYSWKNNCLLLMYYIFYPFALIGIFSRSGKRSFAVKAFSIIYLLITSMAIFLTCDDWANRFISPAFPFILILAAAGCCNIYDRIMRTHVQASSPYVSGNKIQNK